MSNLLPKKLWHVGRSENIERVRVDEEKAKLIEEKTTEEADRAARLSRLETLRKRAKSETIIDGAPDEPATQSDTKSPRLSQVDKDLDTSFKMSKDLGQRPWYCQNDPRQKGRNDEDTKRRLDPVYLHPVSDPTPRTSSKPSTIDELRRERLEREARERQKAADLLQRHRRHA